MPQFFRSNPPLSAESRLNLRVASGATREIAAQNITVDVGPGPVVSTIVRGGKEITAPAFNQNRIDDVLAPMSNIHFGLFDQTHADLAVHPVTDVLPIIQDAAVAPALAKSSAADLTPAEKQLITQKLSSIHVAIDDTNPAKTFELAFNSLKGAQAFQ